MEKYEFTATTAKSDIIIGLISPMIIMFPILGIQLAFFYLIRLNDFFKSYPVFLYLLVFVSLGGSVILVKKIQKNLVKNYVAELYGKNIRIWGNGEEVISGVVSFCKINHKKHKMGARALSVDIYTDTDKIKFRVRAKEYKKITVSSACNPLGTSELSDIKTLLSLGRKIKNTLEEQKKE